MSVRNLNNQAVEILKNLSVREKYSMFSIVLEQLGKKQNPQKQAELNAMYSAIVKDKNTDKATLNSLEKGYQNNISNDIRGGDLTGNARKNKKKS